MGSFQPGLLNLANWMGNVMLPIGAGLILACGIYQFSKGQELERYVFGAMAALLGSGLLRLAEVISQQNDGADQYMVMLLTVTNFVGNVLMPFYAAIEIVRLVLGSSDFREENKMTTKGKVLVLVSSGHGLPLKDGKVYAGAGYYLNELTVPVRALMKEGYEITFANPKGNTPQLDVNSAIAQFFGGDEAKLQDYLKFRDTLTGLKNPTRISDVIASGLDQYDAVFVPGGHGPMMDLLDDPDAGTVMRHFHKTSKP